MSKLPLSKTRFLSWKINFAIIKVFLRKRCPENIQQIYMRTPIPKCDFKKVVLRCKAIILLRSIFLNIFMYFLSIFKLEWNLSSFQRPLHKKCPNTELFLVHIFLYSDWIRSRNNSVFGQFSRSGYLCINIKVIFSNCVHYCQIGFLLMHIEDKQCNFWFNINIF